MLGVSLLFAVLSMLGYGVVDVIAFLLARQADPRKVPLWTTTLSILFLSIGVLFVSPPHITIYDLLLLAFGSAIGVVGILSFYKGLNKGSIAVVVPIANLWPLIAVIAGLTLLGESVSALQLYGVLIAIIGTIFVSFRFKDVLRLNFSRISLGARYALVTMCSWGVFYTVLGFVSKTLGYFWPTLIAQVLVGIGVLSYLLVTRVDISFPKNVSGKLFLFGAVLSIAVLCYTISTNSGYVTLTAPITGSSPLITVLLGVLLLKNKIERNQAVGVLLIIVGIALISL